MWFRIFLEIAIYLNEITLQITNFQSTLRILTPPMETPDPPSDTPGASKKVFLTPHDIPRILREHDDCFDFLINDFFFVFHCSPGNFLWDEIALRVVAPAVVCCKWTYT